MTLEKLLETNQVANEYYNNADYMNVLKCYLEDNQLLMSSSVMGEKINQIKDEIVRQLLTLAKKTAESSIRSANISFGTSGWRGIIGKDFTNKNGAIATRAVIALLKSDLYQQETSLDFSMVQKKGILVGRDTRFLGEEFVNVIISELQSEHIKVFLAGVATTPELSAAVPVLGAAGSINFTPSHNPFVYAGFKFNPNDGGPAENCLTDFINKKSADLMANYNDETFTPKKVDTSAIDHVDTIDLYEKFLYSHHSPIKDVDGILKTLAQRNDIKIAINVVGGAAASFKRLFDKYKVSTDIVEFIYDSPDITFRGGMDTEPRSNIDIVQDTLKRSKKAIKIGFVFDPDGDRIRFYDGSINLEIEMNFFLGLVYYYEKQYLKMKPGFVAKSVATSNFINALVTYYHEDKIVETPVGFKYFRGKEVSSYHPSEGLGFLVAGEESDGMSVFCHTFEKDGFSGVLMALKMVMETNKTIGTLLMEAQSLVGKFYPARGGVAVKKQGKELISKLSSLSGIKKGDSLKVGIENKSVSEVITADGFKIVFTDGSWFLIRPSGTEPKVRFYIETRDESEKEAMFKLAEDKMNEALA